MIDHRIGQPDEGTEAPFVHGGVGADTDEPNVVGCVVATRYNPVEAGRERARDKGLRELLVGEFQPADLTAAVRSFPKHGQRVKVQGEPQAGLCRS
jgi:hypothetical protein